MKRAISMIMVLVLALSMCVVGASAVESDAISETFRNRWLMSGPSLGIR